MVSSQRPVNLDLATLKFPTMAIASILHRISGVLVFLGLPFLFYLLSAAIESPLSYATLTEKLSLPHWKLAIWIVDSALAFHILAGLRHVILDLGFGEDLRSAKSSSEGMMILAMIMILFLGIWIW